MRNQTVNTRVRRGLNANHQIRNRFQSAAGETDPQGRSVRYGLVSQRNNASRCNAMVVGDHEPSVITTGLFFRFECEAPTGFGDTASTYNGGWGNEPSCITAGLFLSLRGRSSYRFRRYSEHLQWWSPIIIALHGLMRPHEKSNRQHPSSPRVEREPPH